MPPGGRGGGDSLCHISACRVWQLLGQSPLSLVASVVLLAVESKLILPLHMSLCLLAARTNQINVCASFQETVLTQFFLFLFFCFFFLFYPVVTSFQSVALNSWGNGERLANCCFTSTKAAAGFLQGKKPKDLGRLGKGLAIWRRILCSGPCCVVLV